MRHYIGPSITVLGLGLILISFALNGLRNYTQEIIDNAYNKGRAMETYCAKSVVEHVPLDCSHHYRNTGHTLKPSIKE